ncbi:M23 family metallopeptidase [Sphingomonas sp. KRR8]|uniref:M23 family metallopeptidase n=1 Tax=Sphingomonas sp. KRR8 TaxID=2942996 RepID=UPI002020DA69|nr:M23 family metallopeptidase [Sphingomonas sp. KRR8]URD62041.1 M23 family metallopeptidase [Sphingomonas sp. KRR8]
MAKIRLQVLATTTSLLGMSQPAIAGDLPLDLFLNPSQVCATDGAGSYPNVDIVIANRGDETQQIEELHAVVRDQRGHMLERRILWQQSLGLLSGGGQLKPKSTNIIYNPFSFAGDVVGKTLTFEVLLAGKRVPQSVSTVPARCRNSYVLKFPIAGRALIYDGYDQLSHHRRGAYDDDWSKQMGIRDNFQRFGLDIVVVDETGRYFSGDGSRMDQWFGWGKPVRAAASGEVVAVHDGQPDNVVIGTVDHWLDRPSRSNPMSSYGNYVLLRHAPREFTLVGHLKNGSVVVRPGEFIHTGQRLGAMGNSGASGGVHTHFERRSAFGLAGVTTKPAYFTELTQVGRAPAKYPVVVGTGDVVVAR